jgi:hypothetical protein
MGAILSAVVAIGCPLLFGALMWAIVRGIRRS